MSRAAEVMVQHVDNLKRHHLREHAELEEMKCLIQQNSRNWQLAETQGEVDSPLRGATLQHSVPTPPQSQRDPVLRSHRLGTGGG